jgi:hypothetical protein
MKTAWNGIPVGIRWNVKFATLLLEGHDTIPIRLYSLSRVVAQYNHVLSLVVPHEDKTFFTKPPYVGLTGGDMV